MPAHSEDDDTINESRTKISAILTTPGDSMLYVYVFGDKWRHEVALGKILPASCTIVGPICLSGERHSPPEDVGPAALEKTLATAGVIRDSALLGR